MRVLCEAQILGAVDHPFVASLWGTISTPTHLHFLMEPCSGGELYAVLNAQPHKRFVEHTMRFYAAEVGLAPSRLLSAHRATFPTFFWLDALQGCTGGIEHRGRHPHAALQCIKQMLQQPRKPHPRQGWQACQACHRQVASPAAEGVDPLRVVRRAGLVDCWAGLPAVPCMWLAWFHHSHGALTPSCPQQLVRASPGQPTGRPS